MPTNPSPSLRAPRNQVTEFLAGASSFMATAYIIVVNPAILSQTGMPFAAVLTATVLVCSFSSIMMGVYAKNPILVAPGMGLNAFFTFSIVKGMNVPWNVALGAVFWAGVIFLLLSIFNIRTHIVKAIPLQLRYAITCGIGLFIALIGFVNAGFVIHNPATVIGGSKIQSLVDNIYNWPVHHSSAHRSEYQRRSTYWNVVHHVNGHHPWPFVGWY